VIDFVDHIMGLSLKSEQLGFGHMAARAVVMYLALVIIVRAAKKRFLSRATAFDFVLAVLLGAVAARAMTGGAPFFPSLLALVILAAIHWLVSALTRPWPSLSRMIKGHPTTLIHDGKVDEDALRNAHMSMDDLLEDLREKGIADPAEAKEARLERSGKLSVIKNSA
jgi:uncharacterized membrane protein YcaP (DUF421 family)